MESFPADLRIVASVEGRKLVAMLVAAPFPPSARQASICQEISGNPVWFDDQADSVFFDLGRRDPTLLKPFQRQVARLADLLKEEVGVSARKSVDR